MGKEIGEESQGTSSRLALQCRSPATLKSTFSGEIASIADAADLVSLTSPQRRRHFKKKLFIVYCVFLEKLEAEIWNL